VIRKLITLIKFEPFPHILKIWRYPRRKKSNGVTLYPTRIWN